VLVDQPVRYGAAASLANGAIEAFVRAAAIELPRGLRINAVSPGVLVESMSLLGPFFRGFEPVPAARVGLGYARSVEGADTGKVYVIH
jgi:NAD(P)-dependent dehydrogenase (short-subunit alcohol dehydrogenase family)